MFPPCALCCLALLLLSAPLPGTNSQQGICTSAQRLKVLQKEPAVGTSISWHEGFAVEALEVKMERRDCLGIDSTD
ncbi:receptor tyrosine-protein kinase erbB-4 [Clarias magur]|uniref:Receptor tyrosine-protein kinase erbB-4 n=1 Tax=Clarias magur TaxID=1594786 RepID=A0A8J4TTP8_CLAMG|nr:receptor tyrosine-protein kinase erbB-4 [Clarias magur]